MASRAVAVFLFIAAASFASRTEASISVSSLTTVPAAPSAPGAIAGPPTSNGMDTDLDKIAAEVFREFLKRDRTSEDQVRIYYVGGDDGFRVNFSEFSAPRVVLERGDGCRSSNTGNREVDTGRPCVIVHLKVLSVQQERADAAVSWHQGPTGAGGLAFGLKKKDGVWAVESARFVFGS